MEGIAEEVSELLRKGSVFAIDLWDVVLRIFIVLFTICGMGPCPLNQLLRKSPATPNSFFSTVNLTFLGIPQCSRDGGKAYDWFSVLGRSNKRDARCGGIVMSHCCASTEHNSRIQHLSHGLTYRELPKEVSFTGEGIGDNSFLELILPFLIKSLRVFISLKALSQVQLVPFALLKSLETARPDWWERYQPPFKDLKRRGLEQHRRSDQRTLCPGRIQHPTKEVVLQDGIIDRVAGICPVNPLFAAISPAARKEWTRS